MTNLVSYYTMEGNSNDPIGSNNGTDTGITYSSGNGKVNQGAGFNGTTSKIQNASPTGIPVGSTARSVCFWCNPSSTPPSVWGMVSLCQVGGGANDTNFQILMLSSNKVDLWLSNDDKITTGTLTNSAWNFVAVTYDGATGITIGINNSIESFTSAGTLNTNSAWLSIGADDQSRFFTGAIDEVGIWSKKLSTTEQTDLYNSGTGNTIISAVNSGFLQFF